MEVNAWICALATDRDLEDLIAGYWFFVRHHFRIKLLLVTSLISQCAKSDLGISYQLHVIYLRI